MSKTSKLLLEDRLKKYNTQEFRDYLQITLTLLMATIFTAFAIRPSITTAFRLNKQVQDYKVVDKKLSDKILALRQARAHYNIIANNIARLDKSLPFDVEDGPVLTNINFIAAKNNIDVRSLNFDVSDSPDDQYKILTVSVVSSGEYPDVVRFLADLNNMLRIVNITSLNISQKKDTARTGNVDVRLSMNTFYLEKQQ